MKLLDGGHHGARLTEEDRLRLIHWIDANGVYYDRYESDAYGPKRNLFASEPRKELESTYARRCATCHNSGDGRQDTWWLSLNRRDVALSRALMAPLAQSAGGWQRCGEAVFANKDDPDYRRFLAALTGLRTMLAQRPREDLLSLKGTAVESQPVVLPAPPPPMPDEAGSAWVYLSNLPWESGRAGWTRNGDGLPRRDRDVTENLLRLGKQRYRKGLGTHAPSEIVYRLDGQYARFRATVGGAEQGGTVVFQVFGDDRLLFESGVLKGMGEVKTTDVSVARVDRLRLVVTDGGDNYYADMANWADAKLERADVAATADRGR
ncbi:MAG: NPCBM/NEW2 domain-containing protein [Pirellulales bacterium]|nr:NPCBM/NEW2 domain-containing protein [Pirellulales bacterium]